VRVSEHFTLSELTKSDTADRLGIDNQPNLQVIENLRITATHILEPVRNHFQVPFSPNSGFRCLELNRALRSKDTSQHITGHAVDFEVPGISTYELALWAYQNLVFDQLILEFYDQSDPSSGWVHCSYAPTNRQEALTIFKDGKAVVGLVM